MHITASFAEKKLTLSSFFFFCSTFLKKWLFYLSHWRILSDCIFFTELYESHCITTWKHLRLETYLIYHDI